mmetsp:Transcript_10121/g.30935  ORF Transcript_10121/g.30935 Transcript_10121/m.30935 type:complete len:288 (+) Transcript_10121:93-956(+)
MTAMRLIQRRASRSLWRACAARSMSKTVPDIEEMKKGMRTKVSTGKSMGGSKRESFESTDRNRGFSERTTHFGFQEVPVEEKSYRVGGVFANVASKYDVMNDLMSGGMHRVWKTAFVRSLGPTQDMSIIDVAGGTGDIAFRVADVLRASKGLKKPIRVIDASPAMVDVGVKRANELKYADEVTFEVGYAENLENVADESMDAYLISFGMRNVTEPGKALAEALRVLKKGGRFLMLEFAKVHNPIIERVYDSYSFNVIPAIGNAVTGDRKPYEYLVESIRQFPDQEVG